MSTDLSIEQIITTVQGFEGVLVVAPAVGDPEFPELAWGDAFFYYAPDGQMPRTVQPYGTIVTKNYPDDTASDLDPAGRWRVNIHVDRATFRELVAAGTDQGDADAEGGDAEDSAAEDSAAEEHTDPATPDVVQPHPVYGSAGWVSVVNPGHETGRTVLRLLRAAHEAARVRARRRAAPQT